MNEPIPFVDLHCHLLPQMDDGPRSWEETVEMARIAVQDGIGTTVVTPHQLGSYRHHRAEQIRFQASLLQERLLQDRIPLTVLPGADVRIEPDLIARWQDGSLMSLADQRRHLLLELPHELFLPLDSLLSRLRNVGCTGILSHPERNLGILAQPHLVPELVQAGCLIQITAASLLGGFGPASQHCAEWLLREGCVHFVASDGHGPRSRRPLLSDAHARVAALTDPATAHDLCCGFPLRVCQGRVVPAGRRPVRRRFHWLRFARAA